MAAPDLYKQFTTTLENAADSVWRRFRDQMPERYFRETAFSTQLAHLHLLSASAASGIEQDLVLKSQDAQTWTFLTSQSRPGQLGQFLARLPRDQRLTSARAYTSRDGHWVIDVFEFGEHRISDLEEDSFAALCQELGEGLEAGLMEPFREHLRLCESAYLRAVSKGIAQQHFHLLRQAQASGNLCVSWSESEEGEVSLRMILEGVGGRSLFEKVARYLGGCEIDIERAYVTSFGPTEAPYRYLGFTVSGADLERLSELGGEVERLHYLDESVLELWEGQQAWTLEECEICHFLVSLVHQLLSSRDSLRFARERLEETMCRHPEVTSALLASFREGVELDSSSTLGEVDRDEDRLFFETCFHAVGALQRCNLHQSGRRSLAARLDPNLFPNPGGVSPYAVFYAVGRGFQGFHVRFQDVARGGMRLVCPRSPEAHSLECERIYREAYGLARAQHLKNKDIPEGGAKAVVLIEPGLSPATGGEAFADALLDLTLVEPPEYVYLGPDENVTNELIEWISERASRRGHPLPSTFMSSKPGAGINHKQYGITSEGVTVFLEVALAEAGLNPESDPFSVVITGGPDGDVAGNEIRILLTRYPETARIVGIADGSGCAEDPQGLDREELLRLVEQVLPVAHFERAKLSPQGRVLSITEPGGVQLRNTLHNRLSADALVPAGGRPHTIHDGNWQDFLCQGRPACPLIVEGANLFLSEGARHHLWQSGVTIVKDSSANKCGVICSSFEILASMLLSEQEFLAVKEQFVQQVLQRLRKLASLEAELLFQERRLRPDLALPELSVRLSRVMLQTAEAVAELIEDPLQDDAHGTRELLLEYLPKLLLEKAGDRIEQIPVEYRRRIVACYLAGKIVYREGITYLEDLPQEALQELATTYLAGERSISALVAQVASSQLPDAKRISQLLELGGARTLTRLSHSRNYLTGS